MIDKKYINKYETFTVWFENGHKFKLQVNEILDVSFIAKYTDGKYCATDGFITISASAKTTKGFYWEGKDKSTFIERLGKEGAIDLTAICFTDCDNNEMDIELPYNPVEDARGNVIKLTNCSFWKTDKKGNIVVQFGEHSK